MTPGEETGATSGTDPDIPFTLSPEDRVDLWLHLVPEQFTPEQRRSWAARRQQAPERERVESWSRELAAAKSLSPRERDIYRQEYLGGYFASAPIVYGYVRHPDHARIYFPCPYCGDEHSHPWELGMEKQPRHRVAHCAKCTHEQRSTGYWIELAPDGRASSGANSGADSGAIEAQSANAAWPEPEPLVSRIDPMPYPVDALPPKIRAAVDEVHGFVKAPYPMVASCALSALSLAIQHLVDVRRADKLEGPCSLFLLTIADSGDRKTTCDRFFTKAIHEHEQHQAEAAKPLVQNFNADMAAWKARQEGISAQIKQLAKKSSQTDGLQARLRDLEKEKPEAPRVPRLIYGDATPEALAYSLAKRWPSGGVVSSEAGVVFGAHGMGKDSIMRNLGMLNTLWDGKDLPIDRKTSDSFTVQGARFTMAVQIQEPTLRSFFDGSKGLARGTGFLARFLIAWPQSTQGQRPYSEPPEHWPALATFNRRIAEILSWPVPLNDAGGLAPQMLGLSAEAKAAWVKFHDLLEVELRSGGELQDVKDVASKTADNAVRLAALFHTFETGGGAISLEAFESASRIVSWHLNESRRFFGELAMPEELAKAARLEQWLLAYCRQERCDVVPIAQLQQYGPNGLRSKGQYRDALQELIELSRVRQVTTGRQKPIHVNPALLNEGG